MNHSLTIFKHIHDKYTHRKMEFDTWNDFVGLLRGLSNVPGYKPKKGEYVDHGSPLISPATFIPGHTRLNANVVSWGGWAALDIDKYSCTFEESLKLFEKYSCVCYSSASSSKENPKYRVVFELDEHVDASKIKHLWYAINSKFNELGDKQTKDLSRMYYVPAQYPDAYHFFIENKGEPICVADLLKEYTLFEKPKTFTQTLPPEIQKKLIEYKKETQLNRKDYKWTSYRDCPFVRQSLIRDYRVINESGWYHQMYRILCSIALSATKGGYPITAYEIESLAREIDADTGGWYENRPLGMEAQRALDYAYTQI